MANATNGTVRTIKPGYSAYFPGPVPSAKKRGAWGYDNSGWMMYKPHSKPVHTSSPMDDYQKREYNSNFRLMEGW